MLPFNENLRGFQEDDGEDEGGTPLAEMASGVWAPIGRPSADMAVRLQRRSSEGPGTASPTRSPVRGASTVNDLDAAWARVQARRKILSAKVASMLHLCWRKVKN